MPYEIQFKEYKSVKTFDKVIVVYQGSFYHRLRKPHVMLNAFSKLSNKYELHIYSKGPYTKLIKKYAQKIYKYKTLWIR